MTERREPMGDLKELFSLYSIEQIILFLVLVFTAGQALWKLIEFYWGKFSGAASKKFQEEQWKKDIGESLADLKKDVNDSLVKTASDLKESMLNLDSKINQIHAQTEEMHSRQDQIEKSFGLVKERMQENTRSYLIDAHHRFCYELKQIDDYSLASMERRYLYYKEAGGNTFIDNLMEEVRALPRVTAGTTREPDGGDNIG
jgi:hypothetical protein